MIANLRSSRAALAALVGGPATALVLLVALHTALAPRGAPDPTQPATRDTVEPAAIAAGAPAPTAGEPVTIEIPVIDVDADLVPLGLRRDGAMEVPGNGLAGWYRPGPRPGQPGPAVVAAHVDSGRGPDVFFRLRDLRPGDAVTVVDDADARHRFVVVDTERSAKTDLPVARIWSDGDAPVLRLITCGGAFDRTTGHYVDNVIVYAEAAT